ncbi:tRNAHis guanylyltransferase [uncultured archaeon]|nr:tRNAHis guanylyltransferase [uncultured archaeon]
MQRHSKRIASWEIYSSLKTRAPLVARADGRGFKKLLSNCKKPYDIDFARSMSSAAQDIFSDSGLMPLLAYIFSDEINLVYLEAPMAGRVEKIDSLVAGFLSSVLSLNLGRQVSMDCRIISLSLAEIVDYFVERQEEAWRNHVFSWGFYMLIEEGFCPAGAMDVLRGMKDNEIHEQAFQKGVNLARTPLWERRGVMVYRKDGLVVQNWELPLFNSLEGKHFIGEILTSSLPKSPKSSAPE